MGKAFKVIWKGLTTVYEDLFRMIAINFFWALIGAPLLLIIWLITTQVGDERLAYLLAGFLFVLIPNPLSVGIYYYANQIAHDERVDISTYWEGVKLYWLRGLFLFVVNLALILIVSFNIYFYLNIPSNIWLHLVAIIWFYVALIWVGIQLYLGPLLIEQKRKGLLLLLRNAFLLLIDNVFFTLTILIIEIILIFIALLIPPIATLLIKSVLATIESFALLNVLEKYQQKEEQAGAITNAQTNSKS